MKKEPMTDNCDFVEIARRKIGEKNYSSNTEKCYLDWIYRFIYFHKDSEIEKFTLREFQDFICFLKEEKNHASSTINQAINAINFLYNNVFNIKIDKDLKSYCDSSKRTPVILTREEIEDILKYLNGEKWLMTCLMYGGGLSISECVQLRIRDIDFKEEKIIISENNNPRKTILPVSLVKPICLQINKVQIMFNEYKNSEDYEGVFIPDPIIPNKKCTSVDLKWHFLFPSPNLRYFKARGKYIQYPISESYLQKAIKDALNKSKITKKICCQTFRHSFAVHLLEDGYDLHIIQKLLGHKCTHSTLVYRDIAHTDIKNIKSPLNEILEK